MKIEYKQEVEVFCSDEAALVAALNDPKTDMVHDDKRAWVNFFWSINNFKDVAEGLAGQFVFGSEHFVFNKENHDESNWCIFAEGFGQFWRMYNHRGYKVYKFDFDLGYGDGRSVCIVVCMTELEHDFTWA